MGRNELSGIGVCDCQYPPRSATSQAGNGALIGGIKVTTDQGWFAARSSGTENVYKLYAESFRDEVHLERIVSEAREMVGRVLRG